MKSKTDQFSFPENSASAREFSDPSLLAVYDNSILRHAHQIQNIFGTNV